MALSFSSIKGLGLLGGVGTSTFGSTAALVGYSVPTIAGLAYSATANPAPTAVGPIGPVSLTFSDNNALKSFNGGVCVNALLTREQWDLLRKDGIGETKWKELGDKFKDAKGESRGCLALSWDKQIWSDDYWKGQIKYEWAFVKGGEAILVDGFYDPSKDNDNEPSDADTQVQTVAQNNWKATYIDTNKREKGWLMWQRNKSIKDHVLNKPRLLTNGTPPNNGDKWDFQGSKKCTTDKCKNQESKKEHGEAKWRWDKSSNNQGETFDHWHEKFEEIFCILFDGTNNTLSALKNLIKTEKGTWQGL